MTANFTGNKKMDDKNKDRLLYSAIIIASFFAYTSIRAQIINWIGPSTEKFILLAIMVSAILSSIYLLICASSLKYEQKYIIGVVKTNKKQAAILYDLSIDIFMFSSIFFMAGLLFELASKYISFDIQPYIAVLSLVASILLFRYGWPLIFRVLEFTFRPAEKGTTLYDKEVLFSMLTGLVVVLLLNNVSMFIRLILGVIFISFIVISLKRLKV